MKRYSVLLVIVVVCQIAIGQTVLLHERISDYDFKMPKRGPNFRHFTHLCLGLAFYVPSNEDNEIETKPVSTTFSIGWRYKYKLTSWLAFGAGINYTNDVFNLLQNDEKVVPNSIQHDKEKLRFNNLGPDAFIRFNFGKRGNVVGRFVDLGAYFNWSFRVKHMFQDKVDNTSQPMQAGKERVILSELNYVEKFHYGFRGRIGLNLFCFNSF
ncbi:MAG: hypothetical protein HC831_19405, partial [Chloroflexia bacterium]|nr:hypothetical protein [Chloroflexia bacterium]